MVNVVSKKCKCGKRSALFNEPGNTTPICCSECKTPTMVDVKSKKCKCGKRPNFNEPGETTGLCCATCKTATMIDIKHKKCNKCGVNIPSFNEPGETTAVCCSLCKTPTMIDVTHNKCKDCGKRPSFNEPGETNAICCFDCKTDIMVNVVSKKCKCGKIPSSNEPGETIAICCDNCKTDTMINVISKKCKCGAIPNFNIKGVTPPICCVKCKTEEMVNVTTKKCPGSILTGCPYNSAGNVKYKHYCTECFRREFPLDPLTFQIRSKTKEIAVRDFINSNFVGFQHDKIMETGNCDCTIRRRIDHRKLIGNTLLVIETDENQHKSYDVMDEETRYDDLFMAHGGKWIYIRFNPDKYKDKSGKNRNPNIATRLEALKTEIEKQIKRIENEENKELVERVYMFYDEVN
jgi:hypothetical protein